MFKRVIERILGCVLLLSTFLCACSGPMSPGRKEQTWFPPFFTSASDDTGDSYGCSVLLNWIKHDRTPERSYSHLIPFYFHEDEADTGGFTLIPPFYFERERTFDEDLFFLLWGVQKRGNRHDLHLLFPLLRYSYYEQQEQRWRAVATPLFDISRDGFRKEVKLVDVALFHLLNMEWGVPGKTDETPKGCAFSFFNVLNMVRLAAFSDLGGYNDFHLLTLFSAEKLSLYQHHWRKEEGDDGRTVLFPFYWHWKNEESGGLHLWPLYGREKGVEGDESTHFLYPLFTYSEDRTSDSWSVDCPWPLVRFMRSEEGDRETRLLPLYMFRQKGDESTLTVPPFYLEYDDGQGFRRQFFTPFYSQSEGPGDNDYTVDPLYPLASFKRSEDERHERLLPLYYRNVTREYSLLECTPLFWRYRNSEDYSFDLLFPLYSHFGFGEDDHTYSILPVFKLIADRPEKRCPNGRTEMDFLWPLLGYSREGDVLKTQLFPLFSYSGDKNRVNWNFLLDFFGFKKEGNCKTFTFLWFIPISWGGDEEVDFQEG